MPASRPLRAASVAAILLAALVATSLAPPASGAPQNDAGTGADAGNTFDLATSIASRGEYLGLLAGGSDANDYYRFYAAAAEPINIEVRGVLLGGYAFAPDNGPRLSFRLLSPQGVLLDTPNSNQGDTRMVVPAAPGAGWYRFQVTQQFGGFTGNYRFCLLGPPSEPHACPDVGMRPQDVIFGGSLPRAVTRVLLVPPTHGDLGNPFGPTALDYLDAALDAIHEWNRVLVEFANDYPQYAYLKQVRLQVAVFDGTQVFTSFDIVIAYVESGGNLFRGVASSCVNPPRCVALSLFSLSPRSGQTTPDYPELNDLDVVVKHEVAHVWGLGHTLTWTAAEGPDLMNSPATFVYGDGSAVGDGGERTAKKCISTLNLYGMALLFQWLAGGPKVTGGSYTLPAGIPYALYC